MAILNFVTFIIGVSLVGGDALNGHVANGHYFLSDHGRYTEVSARTFAYSAWHARSVMVTHILAFIAMGMAYGIRGVRKPESTSSLVEDARGRR